MNKLFSLTAKDFTIEFLRGSGNGGQKKQKTSSACRITHKESGAMGFAQDTRSQLTNRGLAFERCTTSPLFQAWLKLEIAARLQGYRNAEALVDEEMKNIKVEVYENGEWKEDIS